MSEGLRFVDWFAHLLQLEGVECVFTVPGGTAVPLLQAISKHPSLRVVVSKDEAGAAFAADGYAWATGKPGVVVTIGGPGTTNALTGLACSAAQENPVLLVNGEVSTASMGRRAVQDSSELGLDALGMSRPATALSVSASSPEKARHALLEAFRRLVQQRRPVHLSVPLDVQVAQLSGPLPASPAEYRAPAAELVDLRAVAGALEWLRTAERPALLIGRGARHAAAEIRQLAERLGCPVATTCGAKGVFPETHPLSVGVFSFGSGALARAAVTHEVDVLCAVGTGLGEFASMNFSRALAPQRKLIHIDRDAAVFGRNYSAHAVAGDARATLSLLVRGLDEARKSSPRLLTLQREHSRTVDEAATESDKTPIRPERVMRELQRALPRDACVVADIGTSCLFVAHYLKLVPPQRCYIPMAWSCMAHPLAASIGVRLGSQQPTVCVTGDAAFLAKGLEFHAAVEARLSGFVWLVLSNYGHGLVKLGTEQLLGPEHGVEAGEFRVAPDAAAIARAVGARAVTIDHPDTLAPALAEAFTADGPVLLDVRVDPRAEPPMADRIQGLRNGVAAPGARASKEAPC